MSRDVLDLIDAALEDYAMSDDAMRWAPDAPEQIPVGEDVACVAHALHIRSCPRGVWCSEAPTKAEFARAIKHLETAQRAKRDRVRRMHTEYHRRRR